MEIIIDFIYVFRFVFMNGVLNIIFYRYKYGREGRERIEEIL